MAGGHAFSYVAAPLIILKVLAYGTPPPLCRLIGSFLGPSATALLAGRLAFRYVASPLVILKVLDYRRSAARQLFLSGGDGSVGW